MNNFTSVPTRKGDKGKLIIVVLETCGKLNYPGLRTSVQHNDVGKSWTLVLEVSHPSWDQENSWDKHLKFLAIGGFFKLVGTYHLSSS